MSEFEFDFDNIVFKSTVHITLSSENKDFVNKFLIPLRDKRLLKQCVEDALLYVYMNYSKFKTFSKLEFEEMTKWEYASKAISKYNSMLNKLEIIKDKAETAIISGNNSRIYALLHEITNIETEDELQTLDVAGKDEVRDRDESSEKGRVTEEDLLKLENKLNLIIDVVNKLANNMDTSAVSNEHYAGVGAIRINRDESNKLKSETSTKGTIESTKTIESMSNKIDSNEKKEIDLPLNHKNVTEVLDLDEDFGDTSLLNIISSFK